MESNKNEAIKIDGNLELKACDSSKEFQVFITNLFEKNGVLNDLRAYLRGHIVTFLRSVENGDTPESQKHFTQRLQFKFQAMNAVIAEYLLKMNFGYSCSVFISEIPLASMVFDFTKHLFENSTNENSVQFSANDIFQILNYLGMQCDKEHILRIMEDYQKHDEPLLMSILKNASLYGNLECNVDEDCLGINLHSKKNNHKLKCKHCLCCEQCQNYLYLQKAKYKKKMQHMAEFQKGLKYSLNNQNVNNMVTEMKLIEEKLIEEMFEQLKNVYEGEMEILKEGHEKKVKHSLAKHASLMQQHRLELEKEMECRCIAMEEEFRERKDFVAGLAATLKDAHEKLRGARHKLKEDAEDLVTKEKDLKFQIQKAEEALNAKGEEMQKQMKHELKLLEEQHQNFEKEKNAIENERQQLENLKKLNETNLKLMVSSNIQERDNLVKQCDAMRNELDILKKYIVLSNENKSNQDTVLTVNNNETISNSDDRIKVNHVVNDLKKLKNVNFSQAITTVCHNRCQDNVTSRSKCDGTCTDALKRLREEHEKHQEFSKQQSSHIELLSLSLRQMNEAAKRQTYLTEKSSENIGSDDESHVPQRRTYLGNYSTKDIVRDVWKKSQRMVNKEGHGISLRDKSWEPQTSSPNRPLEKRYPFKKKNKESVAEVRLQSPNESIREAKLRLRKLEIEAEAVETSYLKFRQRRAQEKRVFLKEENNVQAPKSSKVKDTKETFKRNLQNENERHDADEEEAQNKRSYEKILQQTNLDFDKYLRKYHDDNKSTVSLKKYNKFAKHQYTTYDKEDKEEKAKWNSFNYLDTPLLEFRKLYQSRSTAFRATNKNTHEKIANKVDSDNIPTTMLDERSSDTDVCNKSEEVQNINTLSKSFNNNNLNSTPQTGISEMLIKDYNVEVTSNIHSTKHKIPNSTIESEINKDANSVEEIGKNKIINGDVNENINQNRNENIVSKEYNCENTIDICKKSTRDIAVISSKDTIEAHKEDFIEENISNIDNKDSLESGTSNDLSNRKTKASDLDISVDSDIVADHDLNVEIENRNGAHVLTEIDKFINVTPPMSHNDTNENEFVGKSVSSKENLNISNLQDINEQNSNENKNFEAEYEEDFSIPIVEDSLSENNKSEISILKSTEEENFWD